MCMLIWHPANAEAFDRAEWQDFHRINRNGFGLAWRAPSGEVRWKKGLMSSAESWQLYRVLLGNGCQAMALHWRMATAGDRNSYGNCHPIEVNRGALMLHNGAWIGPSTKEHSDSVVFARDRLGPAMERNSNWAKDGEWLDRLERHIGSGNKLILWDRLEETPVIVGEKSGVWWRGRWYSNTYAWTAPVEVTGIERKWRWN